MADGTLDDVDPKHIKCQYFGQNMQQKTYNFVVNIHKYDSFY